MCLARNESSKSIDMQAESASGIRRKGRGRQKGGQESETNREKERSKEKKGGRKEEKR